jgi:hypothetical protein
MMTQSAYRGAVSVFIFLLAGLLRPLGSFSEDAMSRAQATIGAPPHIRFNSTLRSQQGSPLAGLHVLSFAIGTSEEGDSLWTETLPVESDEQGDYTVDLLKTATPGVVEFVQAHPLVFVRASIPGSSSFAEAKVITTLPQAIYQDCNLDGNGCSGPAGETATSQLDRIAAANFSVVLNYSVFWGSESQLLAYAAYAHARHLKIMWTFNDPAFARYSAKSGQYLIHDYSEIAASCGCSTNREFLEYLVKLVRDLPATYGYSIGDEPAPGAAANVQNLYNLIRALDDKHPQMVNATWSDANQPSLPNLRRYLDPFGFADMLGADYYPVGTGAPASDTAMAADDVHTIATTYEKPAEMALQAFDWGQYPADGVCSGSECSYPTNWQLETMLRDAVTEAKPKIIFWYDYWDTAKAGRWIDFVKAVNPQRR